MIDFKPDLDALPMRWTNIDPPPERRRAGPRARPSDPSVVLDDAYQVPPDGQPALLAVVQVRVAVPADVSTTLNLFPVFEVTVTV
jgi:hypothetical protein